MEDRQSELDDVHLGVSHDGQAFVGLAYDQIAHYPVVGLYATIPAAFTSSGERRALTKVSELDAVAV